MAQQFTVRLKNEPGALAELAHALATEGIDIRSIGVGAVGRYGCAVLSTNNDPAARTVLRRAKYTFVEAEVLATSIEDHPGALARLTDRLATSGVNITRVLVLGRRQGKADLALTVDDVDRARHILGA
jgi:hypothetical protein